MASEANNSDEKNKYMYALINEIGVLAKIKRENFLNNSPGRPSSETGTVKFALERIVALMDAAGITEKKKLDDSIYTMLGASNTKYLTEHLSKTSELIKNSTGTYSHMAQLIFHDNPVQTENEENKKLLKNYDDTRATTREIDALVSNHNIKTIGEKISEEKTKIEATAAETIQAASKSALARIDVANKRKKKGDDTHPAAFKEPAAGEIAGAAAAGGGALVPVETAEEKKARLASEAASKNAKQQKQKEDFENMIGGGQGVKINTGKAPNVEHNKKVVVHDIDKKGTQVISGNKKVNVSYANAYEKFEARIKKFRAY